MTRQAERSPSWGPHLAGERSPSWRPHLAGGLAFAPLTAGAAAVVAPGVAVGEATASAIVFAGGTASALIGLALGARYAAPARVHAVVGALAAVAVLVIGLTRATSGAAGVIVDGALVGLGWSIGAAIGRKVEHAGHLFPACVVVACADLVSTVSDGGPTHAIAASERVLPLVAISFPVPGTSAWAPVLGVGDLLFMALLLGAAAQHRLPYLRTVALCAVGLAAAGAVSAWLGTAVPALVPISLAVVLGLPEVRALRPRERRIAHVAILVALGLAGATLAAHAFA